ncbi:hypothetical protein JXA88_10315 [Candidatus Fermentibacteria bacterium]|nr:hypothetical protein [Candidatus Fermentibacteria bacterium]
MTRQGSPPDSPLDCVSELTLEAPRAFFPSRREIKLLRSAYATWRASPRGVAVEILRYRPLVKGRFRHVVALAAMSDDWPGMGEVCLGVVHERGWNVQFAHGFVLQDKKVEIGVFVMALGLSSDEEIARLDGELDDIVAHLRKLSVGRRAKAILLAREAKKLKVLTHVIEELERMCNDHELQEITDPMGECAKFFGGRSDEYMMAWPPQELAYQVVSNYRLLEKVRHSGGLGVVSVEPRSAMRETRTCITVVGLRGDVSVEDCLRVVGETLGFYEQYHLIDFTTRDALVFIRLEIGAGQGRTLTELHHAQLERKLTELITGRRAAWAKRIESRGGFEQYARAVIPFLMKEQGTSGLTQVYIALTSRETTTAGFKVIVVYAAAQAEIRPAQRLPELLQSIPGVSIGSVVPARTVRDQRFFIMNISVDLGQFEDTEGVYLAIKERIREVFPAFRDFDEGMRRMETTRLKGIEASLSDRQKALADQVFYSMDEFSRLGMSQQDMVSLTRLASQVVEGIADLGQPTTNPVVAYEFTQNDEGTPVAALMAVAMEQGHGIPSCISDLQVRADVTVSQVHVGDADLTLCRVVGQGGAPLDVAAVRVVAACLMTGADAAP